MLLYNRGDNVENIRQPWDLRAEPRPYFYLDAQGKLAEDDAVLIAQKSAFGPHPLLNFLRRNSRLYGVFNHANLNLSISEPLYRKLRGWILLPFTAASKHATHSTPTYLPQDGWKVTEALVKRLQEDCDQQNAKLVVVTFPNINHDTEFTSQIDHLHKMSDTLHFGFFDLSPLFHWSTDPAALFLKFHFSALGHLVVARELADYLNAHTFR
jgi:hypothetical protein